VNSARGLICPDSDP